MGIARGSLFFVFAGEQTASAIENRAEVTHLMVSKRERLEAAIAKDVADRPPFALWRHFPVDDQTPEGLAESTSLYQARYDYDFVKVTPASSFCLLDWGVEDEWNGNPDGTQVPPKVDYSFRHEFLNLMTT